ncbi:MAG TPA: MFS transporter [Actinophytocola sp.]|jgi:predicted MFS family arabinose efflux permease|nr:MFS transporter [Actinophytocola sp.]
MSTYRPVLTHPQLRRVLPGLAVSTLGDGMALVAVTWLALELATGPARSAWVAVAVAMYTLPSALGAVLFRRLLRGRSGAQLAGWDATLRGVALAMIPLLHVLNALDIITYVLLLGASALLHSWGTAGRYTLMTELLPAEQHLPANAVLTVMTEAGTVIGPPVGGILITLLGGSAVIAIDAATFLILAATYRFALPRRPAKRDAASAAGLRVFLANRTLLGLLSLTFAFSLLFGPVLVAMPIHVTGDLHASAALLSAYYAAFGLGAVLGGAVTGYLRHRPLWPMAIAVVIVFGAAMVPLGLVVPTAVSLASFGIAGFAWGPYMSVSVALYQRTASAPQLPAVLAANTAVTVLSVPLGTMLGGFVVDSIGAQTTMLVCGLLTIALGVCAAFSNAVTSRRGDVPVKRVDICGDGTGRDRSPRCRDAGDPET